MPINWLTVGSLYGAAAVAFGAFGAHGLKSRGISDAKIASWGTAAHYQVRRREGEEEHKKKDLPSLGVHWQPPYTRDPVPVGNASNPVNLFHRTIARIFSLLTSREDPKHF